MSSLSSACSSTDSEEVIKSDFSARGNIVTSCNVMEPVKEITSCPHFLKPQTYEHKHRYMDNITGRKRME